MTLAEADGALTGSFDLVAFGGAIAYGQRQALEQEARFHNPAVRFVRTYAPYAASQIVAAVRNEDVPAVDLARLFPAHRLRRPAANRRWRSCAP